MRLAFIPSAYRTPFAHELAHRLERLGNPVFWICPNRRWTRWLLNHGVDPSRVLDITRYADEWVGARADTDAARAYLSEIERRSRWRIYDLIKSDHLLARRDTDYAIRYLATCARRVQEFIAANGIELVSGELTWAFEQIIGEVCTYMGVTFARPVDVRIPNDRMVFMRSRLEAELIELGKPTSADYGQARALLAEYRDRPRRPRTANINLSSLQFKPERLKLLARHVLDLIGDSHDETSRRPLGLIADHSAQFARAQFMARFGPFEKVVDKPIRPFVLFALHMQPEVTIDVMASPFCNQVETVQALARTLPLTHDLYVKEHYVALGRRARGAYRGFRAIPGVRLIDPFASTFELIKQAALVVTPTGTVAYEASLLRKPAVTMGPTVFSPLVITDHFNPYTDSLTDLMAELAAGKHQKSDEEIVAFLAWLLAQSLPGSVGDALWQPYAMEPAYLDQVAQGFVTLFAKLESSEGEPNALSTVH
jgi:hypothetical protein